MSSASVATDRLVEAFFQVSSYRIGLVGAQRRLTSTASVVTAATIVAFEELDE